MYHPRKLFVVVVLMLLLSATVEHLSAQEGPPPSGRPGGRNNIRDFLGLGPAPDPVAAERGQKLYASNCAFCHGEKGRGADGPSLVRSQLVLHDEKGELIGPVLLRGRPDKGMPPFPSLTEEQQYDIAQFLHMQVELAANRGTYKRLNVVTGDAKKGEAYFNGGGRCNTCHSPTGDLAHIGGKYPADQLQTKFLWPASGGDGVRRVTVTLPSGQSFSGRIKRLDDFYVSMYDSSGNYHSWPREDDKLRVEVEDRLAAHRQLLDQYADSDIHNLLAYLVTLK